MSELIYPTGANSSSVTVGLTSTAILPENGARVGIALSNDSNETIYLSFGDAAVQDTGIALQAGQILTWTPDCPKLAIFGICASGGKALRVEEFTQLPRITNQ
jgi:hypothetical protein